jgi:hypothetical protein
MLVIILKRRIAIYLLFLCSCNTNSKKPDTKIAGFEFPIVLQQTKFDSLEQWTTDGINEIFPKFIGQYKFTDTVNFDDEEQGRNIDERQYIWEQKVYDFDTLSSDGLQIYTDYSKTIISKLYDGATRGNTFFPVYIVNETTEPKLFIAKDNYVFAIQEALDTSDYNSWYAIEARGFDFCGNGYFRRKLLPKEFIVFLMPKYSGTDTTYLRTRIKIGESVIISKPYKGNFNKSQFKVTKDNVWAKDLKKLDYKWMFYGGHNKE